MDTETCVYRVFPTFAEASAEAKELAAGFECTTRIEERSPSSWSVVVPLETYDAIHRVMEEVEKEAEAKANKYDANMAEDEDEFDDPSYCEHCRCSGGGGQTVLGFDCPYC